MKRSLEDGFHPPGKRYRQSYPRTRNRNLFQNQPEFCSDLVNTLITLAELIDSGKKESVDADNLLTSTRLVLQKVGLLEREIKSNLPYEHEDRPCDKDTIMQIIKEFLQEVRSWQERICVQGHQLYDDGSSLSECALHCLLTWQQVFNQLHFEILQKHAISPQTFQSSLKFYSEDDHVNQLIHRLKVATAGNPIIVSWKQHLPEQPVEFTEATALQIAERLHFLCKFAYEKAFTEAKNSSENEKMYKKKLQELYKKYEPLAYRSCHKYCGSLYPWWSKSEEEGLLWIRMSPIKFSQSPFYIHQLSNMKQKFLDHVAGFSWKKEISKDPPAKEPQPAPPPTATAGNIPIMMPNMMSHNGNNQMFYLPVMTNSGGGNGTFFPFMMPSKPTNIQDVSKTIVAP